MKSILWLPSWYPNRTDHFTGDFIQRHAKATSIYNKIIVLHVVKANENFYLGNILEEINVENNLTEHIIYYKSNISIGIIDKIVSLFLYLKIYRRAILKYKNEGIIEPFVHVHVPLKAGLPALWLKRKFNFPFAITEHYDIYNNVIEDPFIKRNFLFRYFVKKIIEQSTVFIPVSNFLGEAVNKMVVAKPYCIVYNTVDTNLFFLKYDTEKKQNFRFIHVSGMTPSKNVEGIINATERLAKKRNDFDLIIVGSLNNKIHLMAKQKNLLNRAIFFTGELSYSEVARQMQMAQSAIVFSKTETMSCVAAEAICCGLPVIATQVGGVPEVINTSNGLCVQSENENELEQAMNAMIDNYDEFDRKKIEQKAHDKYAYENIGKQIAQLYQRYF
ncbi:MAG TPA: glycosyltransferase [Puia sp.]|nr:glycosyltransferase [Puia sp.]